jgi:hypothetical protein
MNKMSWIAGSQFPSIDDYPVFCHISSGSGAHLSPIQYVPAAFSTHIMKFYTSQTVAKV